MRTILVLLLTLAAPLAALAEDAPPRAIFPDEYTAPQCASQMNGCVSFDRWELAGVAAKYRGMHLDQAWVDAHYDEMVKALEPYCKKAAACFATPANAWTFCNDLLQPETLKVCDRFPADSEDRRQCNALVRTYWFGHDSHSADEYKAMRACVTAQQQSGLRTMDVWMTPSKIGPDYAGTFKVFALDAETHVPVMARIELEGQSVLRASGGPGGRPTATYPLKWPVTFNRVPNANGHRDIVAPTVVITADGFNTVRFPMPVDVPRMILEMNGSLAPGRKNTFTVSARDSVTGQPVEARVMAGDRIVGDTNTRLELEWKKGEKRPEIWVTSLFDRYSDVVVAKGE